jgi:hypothetical protein
MRSTPLKLKSFPDVVRQRRLPRPAGNFTRPFRGPRRAINISHSSMWIVNHRNESVGLSAFDRTRRT